MVSDHNELRDALQNFEIHTIYLADDITSGGVTITSAQWPATTRTSITIDGSNPKTGAVHTLTLSEAIQRQGNFSAANTFTFRNINLHQPSGNSGFFRMGTATQGANMTVIFENTDIITNVHLFYASSFNYGTAKIINSDIRSISTSPNDILIDCFDLVLTGNVTISTACAEVLSIGRSASARGNFTITANSNVEIVNRSTAGFNSLLHSSQWINTFLIEENAVFYFIGGNFARRSTGTSTSSWANSLIVDKNASLILKLNSSQSYPNLQAGIITISEGATLNVHARYARNTRPVLQAGTLNLYNPFQVALGTDAKGANLMFQNNMTINATGIKSIRYFADAEQSFNDRGNYIGETRNDFEHWWFQEHGSFNITARNISQNAGTVVTNYNPNLNTRFPPPEVEATMNAGNFNYNSIGAVIGGIPGGGVRLIQIDGGSRMPTVDTIYVGSKIVTGSGVPKAEIAVIWPTFTSISATPSTKTVVDAFGTWEVSVPSDVELNVSGADERSKVQVVQREDISGFSRGDSVSIFADILGVDMKIIGRNVRNIYFNRGEIPDVPEILFYSIGATVKLGERDGRYLLTNQAVPNANDMQAFEALWLNTPEEFRGYLDAEENMLIRQELRGVPANCTVWVMATFTIDGIERTIGDTITYNNLFERKEISLRLVEGTPGAPEDELTVIRPYMAITGNYGVPYNLSGDVLTGSGVRYHRVELMLPAGFADYWTATLRDGSEIPHSIVLNTGFPADYTHVSDDAKGLMYTLYLERIPEMWAQIPLEYVDRFGNTINTGTPPAADFLWVPLDTQEDPQNDDLGEDQTPFPPIVLSSVSAFYERGGRFVPNRYHPNSPVGYYISTTGAIDVSEESGDPALMIDCTNFARDFEPRIEDVGAFPKETVFIVYDTGYVGVREIFATEMGRPLPSSYPRETSVRLTEGNPVKYTAPRFAGFVPIGYEVRNLEGYFKEGFIYNPSMGPATMDQNGHVSVELTYEMLLTGFVTGEEVIEIIWFYGLDPDNSGIPLADRVRISGRWYGYILDFPIPALFHSATINTRRGYGFEATNDGSLLGDAGHRIVIDSGPYQGTWIFDRDDLSNLERRYVDAKANEDVIFRYVFSSDGVMPDNMQYVEISAVKWADNEGASEGASEGDSAEFVSKEYVLRGNLFRHTPREIEDYIFYGYILDDEENVRVTYQNGQSSMPIEFVTSDFTHQVTLVYIRKSEPVTVVWEGETAIGNTVILHQKDYFGYMGESLTIAYGIAQLADIWVLKPDNPLSHSFTFDDTAQEFRFEFKEYITTSKITINYVNAEGEIKITTTYSLTPADPPWVYTAQTLYGNYIVDRYEVFDNYNNLIDDSSLSGSKDTVTINPALGNQTITFHMLLDIVEIRVNAYDENFELITPYLRCFSDAVAGQPYVVIASAIPGYEVVAHSINNAYSAAPSNDTIVFIPYVERGITNINFYYRPIDRSGGYMLVVLREAVSFDDYGEVADSIDILHQAVRDDGTGIVHAPLEIPGRYYILNENFGTFHVFDELDVAVFYYDKDTVDVKIIAVDENSQEIEYKIHTAVARRGEMHIAFALEISSHTLADYPVKVVYVDPLSDMIEVSFSYRVIDTPPDEPPTGGNGGGDGGDGGGNGGNDGDGGGNGGGGGDNDDTGNGAGDGDETGGNGNGTGDTDGGNGDSNNNGGNTGGGNGNGNIGGGGSGGSGGGGGGGNIGGNVITDQAGKEDSKADSPSKSYIDNNGNAEDASQADTEKYVRYIYGSPDGTVRPNENITRAEVAMIFWRLLESNIENDTAEMIFNDVDDNKWYAQAVKYLAEMGILQGYPDGAFKPEQGITRAEFITVVSRFNNLVPDESSFSDVPESHWAHGYIAIAYNREWIIGYPDGSFKPNNKITRAEAITIISRMLGRKVNLDDIPIILYTLYSDLPESHWAFAYIIDASAEL